MISDDVYDDLKRAKGSNSFTSLLKELLESKKGSGKKLLELAGSLEGDKEYDEVMKELKKRWTRWTKSYA